MFEYLIRVELHDEHDYAAFHAAMAKRGFTRTITGDDGAVYDLPTGSYYARTARGHEDVRTVVESAVAEMRREAEIVVARTAGIVWSGLTPHTKTLGEMILALNR